MILDKCIYKTGLPFSIIYPNNDLVHFLKTKPTMHKENTSEHLRDKFKLCFNLHISKSIHYTTINQLLIPQKF